MADRPFVRVYHSDLIRDYPDVWDDDAALAAWLRLLVAADGSWPAPAELPRAVRGRSLTALVTAGLVTLIGAHRYQIRGMDAERTQRQDAARNAAAKRWQSERNAGASTPVMPSRAEPSRAIPNRAEQTAAQMAHMAEYDFLTGLPNRVLLTDRVAQSIALAQRHGKKVALLYLDLDHFKRVNGSLGLAVGDQLLQSVAKRLQACVRHSDTISRQGSDEFLVLLAEVEDLQDASLTAEKLIKAMAKPHLVDGHRLHAKLSVGISLYPDDGKDFAAMARNAYTAVYHAKRSGRNKYQAFTPDMNDRAALLLSIEQGLHHALEQREFVLHYQPKVNLRTGLVVYSMGNFGFDQPLARLPEDPSKFQLDYYWGRADPEYPTFKFPPDSRKTMVAKCVIEEKRITRVSFFPATINKKGQPVELPPSSTKSHPPPPPNRTES
jgi:diguanylate cyclase (GGDEF)-like protein